MSRGRGYGSLLNCMGRVFGLFMTATVAVPDVTVFSRTREGVKTLINIALCHDSGQCKSVGYLWELEYTATGLKRRELKEENAQFKAKKLQDIYIPR